MSNSNIESEVQKCLKDLMHIRNLVPYALYHNEGAESKVTKRMKKYFWAKEKYEIPKKE